MLAGVLGGANCPGRASRRIFEERPKTTVSGLSNGISGYDEVLEDDSRRIFGDVLKVASLSLSREISEEFGDCDVEVRNEAGEHSVMVSVVVVRGISEEGE